jgi:hypothetical protein
MRKTNVQKLNSRTLGAVRQRLGADDENDTSKDDGINRMTADEITRAWSGWHLGDESWWGMMKAVYDEVNEIEELVTA